MSSRSVDSHEAVGSAQVAKATEAELLAMLSITCRACREIPQDIVYSNQPLLKKFCRLKIPQMITTIFNPDWESGREHKREVFKCLSAVTHRGTGDTWSSLGSKHQDGCSATAQGKSNHGRIALSPLRHCSQGKGTKSPQGKIRGECVKCPKCHARNRCNNLSNIFLQLFPQTLVSVSLLGFHLVNFSNRQCFKS